MATERTEPDPMSGLNERGAVTPPAEGDQNLRQERQRPTSPRHWNDAALPLVERNTLPVTPRRRTRPPEAAAASGAGAGETMTPQPTTEKPVSRRSAVSVSRADLPNLSASPETHSAAGDLSAPSAPSVPDDRPVSAAADAPTPSAPAEDLPTPVRQSPASSRRPPRRWNVTAAALLCVGLPLAAYVAITTGTGGAGTRGGAGTSGDASPSGGAATTGDTAGTSVAVSNEFAPAARPPGLPDTRVTPGNATSAAALPPDAAALAAAPPAITDAVRQAVLQAYGVTGPDADRTALCYLIPPSLNGTNSADNVFPVTPWFAGLKARLDRQLTQEVTEGKLTVAAAHEELKTNWVAAAHRHYVRNYGENSSTEARKIENRLNWEKGPTKSGD